MNSSPTAASSGPSPPTARLLSPAHVAALLDRKPQTLAAWRCVGRGPKFVKLGDGAGARVAYKLTDVEDWIASLPVFAGTMEQKASPGRVAAPCAPAVLGSVS